MRCTDSGVNRCFTAAACTIPAPPCNECCLVASSIPCYNLNMQHLSSRASRQRQMPYTGTNPAVRRHTHRMLPPLQPAHQQWTHPFTVPPSATSAKTAGGSNTPCVDQPQHIPSQPHNMLRTAPRQHYTRARPHCNPTAALLAASHQRVQSGVTCWVFGNNKVGPSSWHASRRCSSAPPCDMQAAPTRLRSQPQRQAWPITTQGCTLHTRHLAPETRGMHLTCRPSSTTCCARTSVCMQCWAHTFEAVRDHQDRNQDNKTTKPHSVTAS